METRKPTVYIETTVPNYAFSKQYLEKQKVAREVFELIGAGAIRPFVSRAVVDELTATPDKGQRVELLKLLEGIEVLPITEEVETLAQKYLDEEIFPRKKRLDAQHIAVATVNKLDFIISWNFEHIVRVKTRELVEAVNTLLGYQTPEIVVPEEVIYYLPTKANCKEPHTLVRGDATMPVITEVEKRVDQIRDNLVAQMEKLGAKEYQQKRNQELNITLKELGLRTKPTGNNTFILAPAKG